MIMHSNARWALMVAATLGVGCGKAERATGQPAAAAATTSSTATAVPRASAAAPAAAPRPLPPSLPPLANGVVLDVDTTDFGRSGVSAVRVTTNLPDNTEIVVSAEEPGDFGNSYSDIVTVRNGRLGGESPSGDAAIPDGVYLVEVTMVSPASQPEDVQNVIGEAGERLSGKLVKKTDHGTTVVAQTKALVGSKNIAEAASLKRATERRVALRRILSSLDRLERVGRATPHELTPECMARMRADHGSLRGLASELDQMALPLPGVFDLGYAARILQNCVSCAEGVMETCDDGRSKLRTASAAIAAGKLR